MLIFVYNLEVPSKDDDDVIMNHQVYYDGH